MSRVIIVHGGKTEAIVAALGAHASSGQVLIMDEMALHPLETAGMAIENVTRAAEDFSLRLTQVASSFDYYNTVRFDPPPRQGPFYASLPKYNRRKKR